MTTAALRLVLLLTLAVCTYATQFYNPGVCPDNKVAGDRWNPFGTCLECYCDQKGYGCSGCDTVTPIFGCYTVVDKTLKYPECCPRLRCPPAVGGN